MAAKISNWLGTRSQRSNLSGALALIVATLDIIALVEASWYMVKTVSTHYHCDCPITVHLIYTIYTMEYVF